MDLEVLLHTLMNSLLLSCSVTKKVLFQSNTPWSHHFFFLFSLPDRGDFWRPSCCACWWFQHPRFLDSSKLTAQWHWRTFFYGTAPSAGDTLCTTTLYGWCLSMIRANIQQTLMPVRPQPLPGKDKISGYDKPSIPVCWAVASPFCYTNRKSLVAWLC